MGFLTYSLFPVRSTILLFESNYERSCIGIKELLVLKHQSEVLWIVLEFCYFLYDISSGDGSCVHSSIFCGFLSVLKNHLRREYSTVKRAKRALAFGLEPD